MTFIIDMITGERIFSCQPCSTQQATSNINSNAANEMLVSAEIQSINYQETVPETAPVFVNPDINTLIQKLDE